MKKEFIVKGIDSASNGLSYVIVSLSSMKDLKEGQHQNPQSPFGKLEVMGLSNMNDMMNNLNKMFVGGMGMQRDTTQLKLEMHEYKDMNIAIEDKVFLELSKGETLGV